MKSPRKKTLVAVLSGLLTSVVLLSSFCLAAQDHHESASSPALKIHPRVFHLIDCWVSDSARPVVTEVNLDAVKMDGNEFNDEGLTQDGEWAAAPGENGGFLRYRQLSAKGNHYKVEYQENGGGSLTSACIIEFSIEKREIHVDTKSVTMRALRVLSISSK